MNKVLYVENDPQLMELVSQFLSFNDWNVTCATNSSQARKLLNANSFDALLLDFDLGHGETSLEILEHLQRQNICIGTVIYSGESASRLRQKTNYQGLVEIIEKGAPKSLPRVLSALKNAL